MFECFLLLSLVFLFGVFVFSTRDVRYRQLLSLRKLKSFYENYSKLLLCLMKDVLKCFHDFLLV